MITFEKRLFTNPCGRVLTEHRWRCTACEACGSWAYGELAEQSTRRTAEAHVRRHVGQPNSTSYEVINQ